MVDYVNNTVLSNYNKILAAKKAAQNTAGTSPVSSNFSNILKTAINSKNQLETSVSLEDIFERAADQYNVPINLLKAVGKAESNFNPDAVSHCGAQGVMQLMPSTASSLGVQDSFNPEQNIMGGAKLLGQLLTHYNGDTKLALAAYNAGCGNVEKYGGVPPFEETQNYVVKVMDYAGESITAPTAQSYSLNSLSSSSNNSSNNSTAGIGDTSYTYDDYLLFLQLMLAQIQSSLLSPNNSSIGSLTDSSSNSSNTNNYTSSFSNLLSL